MKVVRVKYIPPLGAMIQDLQRIFPELTITAANLDTWGGILINTSKKRFVYVKEFRNGSGVRTHVIVYALVKDSFIMPIWIQGEVLSDVDINNPIDHYFLGHQIRVFDNDNETPEEEIP